MLAKLRKYEVQARAALVLSLVSILPLLLSIVLIVRNYRHDARQVIYRSEMYALAFLACVGMAGLLGLLACILGFSSAGQRRNDVPSHSWIGFFIGGATATLAIIVMLAFVMLRLKQTV